MNKQRKPTHCFYVPGECSLIDAATIDNRGMYSGETLEEIRKRHPKVELVDYDKACELIKTTIQAKYVHGPIEITKERFEEMLNVLPPVAWKHGYDGQSFKMMERTIDNITSIFCEVGGRYFELSDDIHKTHEWIVAQCRAYTTERIAQ